MKHNRSEKGQTLVLIVLSIVGLMGFAALAVDLGLVYSVRRQAQTAADSAALAAAVAYSRGTNPTTAALSQLAQNGFGVDADPAVNLTKEEDIQIYNPPATGPYSTVANRNEYFQIVIRKQVRKIFSQFVFAGAEVVTVDAVTHATPVTSTSAGNALHALSRDACRGIIFNGSGTTSITGGNIFSNAKSNSAIDGGSCDSGVKTGSSGSINVSGGEVRLAGGWSAPAGATVNPPPVTGVDPIYIDERTPPSCAGLPARTFDKNVTTLQPGVYSAGINITSNNIDYTLQPGLYCITGGDLSVGGGSFRSIQNHPEDGVVIYMGPSAGMVNFGGNANIWLSTGSKVLDGKGDNYGGYLIFMDKNNHNQIKMSGNNGTFYHGTIYAPGPTDNSEEKCNITGTAGSMSLRSNVICYTIGIGGSATVSIDYRPEENARNPPVLELTQ